MFVAVTGVLRNSVNVIVFQMIHYQWFVELMYDGNGRGQQPGRKRGRGE